MKRNKDFLRERTLELLESQQHRSFKAKELARQLKIPPRDYAAFRSMLQTMAQQGQIIKQKRNRYCAPQPSSIATGKLSVKSQGYGFLLTPEGEEDVFIGMKHMGTAFDGDTVKVQLFARTEKRRPEGRVIEIVDRGRDYIVGTLRQGRHYYFLVPDDMKITRDIYIHDEDLNGAEPGMKVAVKIDHWEDELLNPEGHVAKVLGFPGEAGVDVLSVAASFNLPISFPKQIEAAAHKMKLQITPEIEKARIDLRKEICYTIDPPDAKDFDDAVSIRTLENGNWEIGVHIADVSHYVDEGSILDREALQRATSVYLVDRVVPMLPEKLSNELCSLREGEDRLTYSCIMELRPDGTVVNYRIAETIINSRKRFTYKEVQEFLDGKRQIEPELAKSVKAITGVARILRRRRLDAGSLEFETPEVKVVLDDKGFPVDIVRKEPLESMRVIEELMLLANRTVASHVRKLTTEEEPPPFIYRIHEKPDPEKMSHFVDFVRAIGHEPGFKGPMTSKKLSRFIRRIQGTKEETIIENVMLRSLMKARYDTKNAGHFGLAFKNYTHFTSPIRRYPDLAVHRTLKYYAKNGWNEALRKAMSSKLQQICEQSSDREVVALEAERASIKMKQVEFMTKHLGQTFDGIISGVTHFGFFVELVDYLVEGLVHISDLNDDYYVLDEKLYRLEGTSSRERFSLGDPVRVKVVRVDPDERIIDFILVEKIAREQKEAKPAQPAKAQPKPQGKKQPKRQKQTANIDHAAKKKTGEKMPKKKKDEKEKEEKEKPAEQPQEQPKPEAGDERPEVRERSTTKRRLTRADDDRAIFTTMRSNTRGGRPGGNKKNNSNRPKNQGNKSSRGSKGGRGQGSQRGGGRKGNR